jgi:asparagine synthetase B (glutamine-hydrolysing)
MRLMSDVPLGAMLSGGLDSSLIVALMARHMSEPVKTFAIGFRGVGSISELDDARRVSAELGTEHHELELPLASADDVVDRLAWHMDEPVRSLSALGFLSLSAEHADAALRVARGHQAGAERSAPLGALLYLDAQLALVDDMLHYFDRASMAHSLEVRVPFLDHQLVETCARIPDNLKVRGRETKHILRSAARGLVPDFVFAKPKLGFFGASTGPWLGADNGAIVERVLLAPDARYGEVIERPVVERIVADWRGGAADRSQFLLAMVMLEVWLSGYLPRAFAAARAEPVAA